MFDRELNGGGIKRRGFVHPKNLGWGRLCTDPGGVGLVGVARQRFGINGVIPGNV